MLQAALHELLLPASLIVEVSLPQLGEEIKKMKKVTLLFSTL